MTAGIHRCDGMRELEQIGALVGDLVRTIPTAVSVTRLGAADSSRTPYATERWVLQLCAGSGVMLVSASYCPFCGLKLGDESTDELAPADTVAEMIGRLSR